MSSSPRQLVDQLNQLEAGLSMLLKDLVTSPATVDLQTTSSKIKTAIREHGAVSQEARAACLATSDYRALQEVADSGHRLSALQSDSHRLLAACQSSQTHHLLSSFGTAAATPAGAAKISPADAYSQDITGRLSELNTSLKDHVGVSQNNVQSLERSVRSIKNLSTRYREFGEVSGESRRLVSRHAAKKKRDLVVMKAAICVFAVVCVLIFLKRVPLLLFIMRLLYRAFYSICGRMYSKSALATGVEVVSNAATDLRSVSAETIQQYTERVEDL